MKNFELYLEELRAPIAKVKRLEKYKDKIMDKQNSDLVINAIALNLTNENINEFISSLK